MPTMGRAGRPETRDLKHPITFMAGEIEGELLARADPPSRAAASLTARRDLTRYYAALRRSLPTFTEAEASVLADVSNGTLWEPHTVPLLWAEVADAEQDGIGAKWRLSQQQYAALVARLRALTYMECLAVADAVERYWHGPYRKEAGTIGAALRAVGLVKKEAGDATD